VDGARTSLVRNAVPVVTHTGRMRNHVLERTNWRVFAILLAAGLSGVLALLPLMVDLVESQAFGPVPDMPLAAVIGLALLQNGVLLALFIFIGLRLSERLGLRMPLVLALANGQPVQNVMAFVRPGVLLGAATGVALIGLEALLFLRHLPPALAALFDVPLWKRLLGGVIYGGITEELIMRLFLLSSIAWLLAKVLKTPSGAPRSGVFWLAIVIVAILFGLGHLPITAALTPLTSLLVVRALVLNGVAGIVFGYLYWRHGLESAMLGHMSAHLVMQWPGVLLLKSLM
jgi:membrane protease YdiL (CAAX protease family)